MGKIFDYGMGKYSKNKLKRKIEAYQIDTLRETWSGTRRKGIIPLNIGYCSKCQISNNVKPEFCFLCQKTEPTKMVCYEHHREMH